MKSTVHRLAIFCLALGLFATGPGSVLAESPAGANSATQQEKAFDLFRQIFELSATPDRAVNSSRMRELYIRIINECPDTPLAQESYLRLIAMAFEPEPPRLKEAITLFTRFTTTYPDSPLMNSIRSSLSRMLYATQAWQELLEMESPLVAEFHASGQLSSPLSLFYYAEASYHLLALPDAEKGYRALIDNYADSRMAALAAMRLGQMEKK